MPVTDNQSIIGSFGTHIWESFFLYLHPVMGVGFHLHIITICSLLRERFILIHFVFEDSERAV